MPAAVSTAIEFMTSQTVSVLSTVTSNSVLCLGIAMWVIGGAISLFQRLV